MTIDIFQNVFGGHPACVCRQRRLRLGLLGWHFGLMPVRAEYLTAHLRDGDDNLLVGKVVRLLHPPFREIPCACVQSAELPPGVGMEAIGNQDHLTASSEGYLLASNAPMHCHHREGVTVCVEIPRRAHCQDSVGEQFPSSPLKLYLDLADPTSHLQR